MNYLVMMVWFNESWFSDLEAGKKYLVDVVGFDGVQFNGLVLRDDRALCVDYS